MKGAIFLIGLLLSTNAGADPVVEGQVRLASGAPVAGARILIFDRTNLSCYAQTTADEAGKFVLPLAGLRSSRLPSGFGLGQNYPNPFNPGTVLPYQLATEGYVRLEVFNLLGQRVETLVDGVQAAGSYAVQWDARGVAAGVYLYRLTTGAGTATRRMVLLDGSVRGSMGAAVFEVQEDAAVYGLTVSAAGLETYMDADFRVGMGPVDVVVSAVGAMGRGKVATGGILGDVNNDGQVNIFDAVLVQLYSENPLVEMPNNGDISLGDVNGDGLVDSADSDIITQYTVDPSDPSLPAGIGGPVEEEQREQTQTFSLPNGAEMDFSWIEPGVFQMGSPKMKGWHVSDEGPVHEVEISAGFYLGTYEVTQGQWEAVMGAEDNPSFFTGDDRLPVDCVSWNHVQEFISRLNAAEEDSLYRLPSEAEWEYACRAGSQTRWSFGDDESLLPDYAWYSENFTEESGSKVVGSKLPNPWGLFDMHGNVWEWVQDWYDEKYYGSSPRVDPRGPSSGWNRVYRGGDFDDSARNVRSARRYCAWPTDRFRTIGVRIVRIR